MREFFEEIMDINRELDEIQKDVNPWLNNHLDGDKRLSVNDLYRDKERLDVIFSQISEIKESVIFHVLRRIDRKSRELAGTIDGSIDAANILKQTMAKHPNAFDAFPLMK